MKNISFRTPILFLIFNRPETTAKVFQEIRNIKPTHLYIVGDGPRKHLLDEDARVAEARQIATAIDWPCQVKTLFRNTNLGCKKGVSEAINWFFHHEERGIILEDDCLPHPSFFLYCDALLEKYKDNQRVMAITGDNFQDGQARGDASYYFSVFNHVWGWATWRRAWELYDVDMKFWPDWRKSREWKSFLGNYCARRYWEKIFDNTHAGKVDTWDYQWTYSVWRHQGLTATPNTNLVSNIGFGSNATHTKNTFSPISNLPVKSFQVLSHPSKIKPDLVADRFVLQNLFLRRYCIFLAPFLAVQAVSRTFFSFIARSIRA